MAILGRSEKRSGLRRALVPLGMGLFLVWAVSALYVIGTPFLDLIELKAMDAMFLWRGPQEAASDQVVVVTVDERSLDEDGRWPWPRQKVARLIEAVSEAGARVIGLDMGFFEPDNRFEAKAILAINRAAREGRPLSEEEIITNYHPDYILAQAIASVQAEVVLGYFFHMDPDEVAHLSKKEIRRRRKMISKFALPAARFRNEAAMERSLIKAIAPETNQPILTRVARTSGAFNILPEGDGVVRRVPLVFECAGRYYPSLSLAVLTRYLGQKLPVIMIEEFGTEEISLGDRKIPVDEKARFWINFRGGSGAVKTYEASDALRSRIPEGALAGKAVLIGASATGLFDVKSTPFETTQPGVEVQAQVIGNIIGGATLVRPSWARLFDLFSIFLMGMMAAGLTTFLKPTHGGLLTSGLGILFIGGGFLLFLNGYLINLTHPMIAALVVLVSLTAYRYLTEEREKKFVRNAFQHYLNPSIISEVLEDPGGLELGGQKKDLSILFADIRDFTSISEKMEPELLSHALNRYLDRMTAVIFNQDGVLDKYIGDAVMAFFGAPIEQPDHAVRACRTALDMVSELEAMGPEWQAMGLEPWKIGIGLNTGPVIVGNMGSSERFDYTVIGDNVNTASRLEGQTKDYGVQIIVGEGTKSACEELFSFRMLDLIRVKGKQEPVAIYELLGTKSEFGEELANAAEAAFEAYLDRRFDQASNHLDRILRDNPNDPACVMLKGRCLLLAENPPGEGWDGVEVKETK